MSVVSFLAVITSVHCLLFVVSCYSCRYVVADNAHDDDVVDDIRFPRRLVLNACDFAVVSATMVVD